MNRKHEQELIICESGKAAILETSTQGVTNEVPLSKCIIGDVYLISFYNSTIKNASLKWQTSIQLVNF